MNGAYQSSLAGGGIAVGDRNALYCADASQGGILVKKPYNGAAASVMAYDVRFLHLTNVQALLRRQQGGEDCVIRLNTQSGSREVLARVGVALKFALCDGVMYTLDANAALKERTLSGEEGSELMTGVSDFTLDATGKALLCVTQDGVVSFGHQTGQSEWSTRARRIRRRCAGRRCWCERGGSIVRVMNGQMATIRRDGATCLLVCQKVIELTGRGVMTCDVNGENATTIANGSFEAASIANGVLYLGGADGYTQA